MLATTRLGLRHATTPICRSSIVLSSSSARRWRSGQAQAHTPEAPLQRRTRTVDRPPTTAPSLKTTATPQHKPLSSPVPPAATAAANATTTTAAATASASASPAGKNEKGKVAKNASGPSFATAEKDQAQQMARMQDAAMTMVEHDPWAQALPLFDVRIPKPVPEDAGRIGRWRNVWENSENIWGNLQAMYALGSTNAFPDVNLPPPTGFSLPKHWSRELFRTESTDPKAWVSGIRKACLETYVQLHEHIPRSDVKALRRYTHSIYMEQAAKLMRDYARRKSDAIYTWSLVAEKSPCKIVSLRAIEANLGTLRPGVSRYAVQALVKFDTTQRLEARERRGGRVVLDRTQDVTEYLVLERRLWQKGVPWVIREQLYEGIEAEITMPMADQ